MTFTYTKLMFSFLHLMLCSAALSLEFSWTRSIYSSSLLFHPSPFLSCRTSDFCTKPSCISHIFFLQHFFAHSFLRNFISLPTHSARSLYFMIFVYFVNSAIVATYDAASIVYCSDETDTLTAIFHTDDHHPSGSSCTNPRQSRAFQILPPQQGEHLHVGCSHTNRKTVT
ncbi:hypothetical protein KP509_23G040500 [Ceratopteris richardii]|uniref:Secreted protein n=1 Tax=Ceratopteris richardii TaxID=49495 RepID=A0A8T2S1C4_CERRI|nr:hypothetical protein KP509_23G040500 [Ceratopteris richardii]